MFVTILVRFSSCFYDKFAVLNIKNNVLAFINIASEEFF